ncbi:hypothetical protein [Zooshikella ganghwensis]|uniref:Uncharacterized protein n=1 Tax=Zooshikella ganghwensis TaxID=202772 RepID=A0A4P9VHW4_9GAMM|nr:hypothetical protein [Zooshikella ganghwensis]RDH41212.1 hypothetical protein B9G39_29900 [Zooshikella ganghwensis]
MAEANATFAVLSDEGEDLQWVPYLSKALNLSRSEIKRLLAALEDASYIRTLPDFVGNIKLLDKTKRVTNRVNLAGGYCGHDNDHPEFELARPINLGKRSPSIIINSVKRISDYLYRPHLIPSLKYCQPHKKARTKKGVSRCQYAQRRYACVIVLAALLRRMDIKTLQIVVADGEGSLYNCKVKS